MTKEERASALLQALKNEYPLADCTLTENDPWRLLVQVRLAAQCTDARVNLVTPALFKKYPDCFSMAEAELSDVEELIRSCGFFHSKARDIILCAQTLRDRFAGRVPDTMEELLTLPGVGRKSANLILGDVYRVPGSVVVDTHCIRLTNRMGLAGGEKDPVKLEHILRPLLPPEESNDFCHRLVLHGRSVCRAPKPLCESCCCAPWCETKENS